MEKAIDSAFILLGILGFCLFMVFIGFCIYCAGIAVRYVVRQFSAFLLDVWLSGKKSNLGNYPRLLL